jgi:hypothetical protein
VYHIRRRRWGFRIRVSAVSFSNPQSVSEIAIRALGTFQKEFLHFALHARPKSLSVVSVSPKGLSGTRIRNHCGYGSFLSMYLRVAENYTGYYTQTGRTGQPYSPHFLPRSYSGLATISWLSGWSNKVPRRWCSRNAGSLALVLQVIVF